MGEFIKESKLDLTERMQFVKALVDDVSAMETMLENGLFEDDITRIGAEQELCIVDQSYQPKPISKDLLEAIDDPHFTHELARFNMEINLDPLELKGQCFSEMSKNLKELLKKARVKASDHNAYITLAGILPTIGKKELSSDYITPITRYFALNDTLKSSKGSDFSVKIRGVDEVAIKHDSVMFEACNTSFQLHLQIASHDFISSYNWAQAIAGPILAIACNSPLLLGRELWKETRIALFQQSLDTRKTSYSLKDQSPRVGFGWDWEKGSVAEIFKADISRHPILLTKPISEQASDILSEGKIPKLQALNLHNGTVYRWNRPCYGIGNGKPHLRIENRYLPSGPTVEDEFANFALWIGLMKGRPEEFDSMAEVMNFKEAKNNFVKAARYGKESVLIWKHKEISAVNLMKDHLLPIAENGLESCGIAKKDINYYLGIIKSRLDGNSGAQWQVKNLRNLQPELKLEPSLRILTRLMTENESNGFPVHQWKMIPKEKYMNQFTKVGDIMSRHLLVLKENEIAGLAEAIMKWNNIHHIPVENDAGELKGLLTWSHLSGLDPAINLNAVKVKEVMINEIFTTSPEVEISEAKALMDKYQIGCLPVIEGSSLIGIISKKDL